MQFSWPTPQACADNVRRDHDAVGALVGIKNSVTLCSHPHEDDAQSSHRFTVFMKWFFWSPLFGAYRIFAKFLLGLFVFIGLLFFVSKAGEGREASSCPTRNCRMVTHDDTHTFM